MIFYTTTNDTSIAIGTDFYQILIRTIKPDILSKLQTITSKTIKPQNLQLEHMRKLNKKPIERGKLAQ